MRSKPFIVLIAVGLMVLSLSSRAAAEEHAPDARDKKIEQLERTLEELAEEVKQLKEERAAEQAAVMETQETVTRLTSQVDDLNDSWAADTDSWVNKFTIGGYADVHANFGEGDEADQFDIHRLVLYLGYDFNDWIKFSSETELEPAWDNKPKA
jgi:hypothetical protein